MWFRSTTTENSDSIDWIESTYSFDKHLHFRFCKMGTKFCDPILQLFVRDYTIIISIHHFEHLFYVLNLFSRQVISNHLLKYRFLSVRQMFPISMVTWERTQSVLNQFYEQERFRTLRALLLNLFILENCFNLDFTMSPRGTFGAFLAFCSQGCSAIREKRGAWALYWKKSKSYICLKEKWRNKMGWCLVTLTSCQMYFEHYLSSITHSFVIVQECKQ